MSKLIFVLSKDNETKEEVFKVKKGFGAISNPFNAMRMVKKMMEYDGKGWLLVDIKGDDPELVATFRKEMLNQMRKGEKKALEDVKSDFHILRSKKK